MEPIQREDWSKVERHLLRYPRNARTWESLKRKFHEIANIKPPTGNPTIPPLVSLAKQIKEKINGKSGNADVEHYDDVDDEFDDEGHNGFNDEEANSNVIVGVQTATTEVAAATRITAENPLVSPKALLVAKGPRKFDASKDEAAKHRSDMMSVFEDMKVQREELNMRERSAALEEERNRREEERARREKGEKRSVGQEGKNLIISYVCEKWKCRKIDARELKTVTR